MHSGNMWHPTDSPVLGGMNTTPTGEYSIPLYQPPPPPPPPEEITMLAVTVPSRMAGKVIGRQSANLRDISAKSGANCEVDPRPPKDPSITSFFIHGTQTQIDIATRLIQQAADLIDTPKVPGQRASRYVKAFVPYTAWKKGAPAKEEVPRDLYSGQLDYRQQWADYFLSKGDRRTADILFTATLQDHMKKEALMYRQWWQHYYGKKYKKRVSTSASKKKPGSATLKVTACRGRLRRKRLSKKRVQLNVERQMADEKDDSDWETDAEGQPNEEQKLWEACSERWHCLHAEHTAVDWDCCSRVSWDGDDCADCSQKRSLHRVARRMRQRRGDPCTCPSRKEKRASVLLEWVKYYRKLGKEPEAQAIEAQYRECMGLPTVKTTKKTGQQEPPSSGLEEGKIRGRPADHNDDSRGSNSRKRNPSPKSSGHKRDKSKYSAKKKNSKPASKHFRN